MVPPLHSRHTPLPTFSHLYTTKVAYIPCNLPPPKRTHTQLVQASATTHQRKHVRPPNMKCAVCWEERPAFWSCVCAPGRVCKSCYTHPLYDPRTCPTCRRSDVDIVLKEKYDVRLKWFLIFIYTIATGIYVFLFAFVCYMLYTRVLGICMCFSSVFLLLVYIE